MTYKPWGTIICIIVALMLSGCSLGGNKAMSRDNNSSNEVMEGFDKHLVVREGETETENEADDFSTEVRHWKYGQQPAPSQVESAQPQQHVPPSYLQTSDSGTDDGKVVTMQFLTVQDLDRIQQILIQKGYLENITRDEKEFRAAVAQFQRSNKLPPTGELNADTVACLNQQAMQ
jgi:hypothetical protein